MFPKKARILSGTRPAGLPFEEPTRLQAARQPQDREGYQYRVAGKIYGARRRSDRISVPFFAAPRYAPKRTSWGLKSRAAAIFWRNRARRTISGSRPALIESGRKNVSRGGPRIASSSEGRHLQPKPVRRI